MTNEKEPEAALATANEEFGDLLRKDGKLGD